MDGWSCFFLALCDLHVNPTLEHWSKFQEERRKNGKRKKLNQSHFNQEKTSFAGSPILDPLFNSLGTWSSLTMREPGILKILAGHIVSLNKIRILLSKEEKRRGIRQATGVSSTEEQKGGNRESTVSDCILTSWRHINQTENALLPNKYRIMNYLQ